MTDDDRLKRLLRSALPPVGAPGPARDLWPLIINRSRAPVGWSWLDVNMGIVVLIVLLMFPDLLWLLTYHL
jgi:hypothetical protein